MGFYKKVKFPFEVTKGKSKDLYQLRFMRKSELEPSVRHNLRHNACQMGRQLDLWFKEQLFTIGSLTKEQEKIHQSRKRFKTEIRRSKKREYARRQEEIRISLKEIKMKMLMMKVIQKFKDNVSIARSYRQAQTSLTGNVDVLRVCGNKQLLHGSDGKTPRETERKEKTGTSQEEKHSLKDYGKAGKYSSKNFNSQEKIHMVDSANIPIASDDDGDNDNDYDRNEERDEDEAVRYADNSIPGQRNPSPHGLRMETIPEETEEVEIEMENYRERLPRLTKTRLNLLNRSESKRDIFDVNEGVPLLPEVPGQYPHVQSNMEPHLPDTADKETQTSDKSKSDSSKRKKSSHLRRNAETSECNGKKTIVVKLPRSNIHTPKERESSAKSNSGHFGSDESDDDYNEGTTDTDFAYGFESDLITTDTDDFVEHSEDDNATDEESQVYHTLSIPEDFSLTLTKSKTKFGRKAENSANSQSFPTVTNLEANFPNITTFSIQNPFSVRYKERSFFMKPSCNERLTGSAKLARKAHGHYTNEDKKVDSQRQENPDVAKESKKHRGEEIKKLLMHDNRKFKKEDQNIAVYGRKPDVAAGPNIPSPSNTLDHQVLKSENVPSRTHQSNLLYTQKRTKTEKRDKLHIVSSEPVQRYERTRSGKIRPFGTPRIPNHHEIPTLKERYYRDKLLKSERDSILKQNIRMKRFIDTFDKGRDSTKLPTVSSGEDPGHETSVTTSTANRPRKTFGNFLFKVHQPEQDVGYERKVVPGVSTTSIRLLKNCRYLREYKPLAEREELYSEKQTSWDTAKTRAECNKTYLANVRVSLI